MLRVAERVVQRARQPREERQPVLDHHDDAGETMLIEIDEAGEVVVQTGEIQRSRPGNPTRAV